MSGCPLVSALSALVLMEAAFCRTRQMLTMHMERTAFDVDQVRDSYSLQSLLLSSSMELSWFGDGMDGTG